MKKSSLILMVSIAVILFVSHANFVYGQDGPTEEWVARYNGPGNNIDFANAIAVDPSGNVYVTGYSDGSGPSRDYATVKYDRNGNEVWVATYNGPGNGHDSASAIAVDPSGNVYVTGISPGIGTAHDYATVKYDRNGNEVWVARYNGPGNNIDRASAIAVSPSGNVYVTGYSYGIGTSSDYATVKYDRNGNEVWVARYNGPGNLGDYARAIAVDPLGNVYVTGGSAGIGTPYNFATVKYDRNGNEVWIARYNGPGNLDSAYAIAVEPSGNVYVTGSSDGIGTAYDYATVMYDRNGNEVWVARYNGPGNLDDFANAIAVDPSGNVYVTGESDGIVTRRNYATVKYDRNGNEVWVARYNCSGDFDWYGSAIAVDPSGNVYVAGYSYGIGTSSDYATVKYDSAGNEVWVARYNGPGNSYDCVTAIAVDPSGNVYVTGISYGIGTACDYATVMYSK
jgi:uncharacterized delta-60 repeat protein